MAGGPHSRNCVIAELLIHFLVFCLGAAVFAAICIVAAVTLAEHSPVVNRFLKHPQFRVRNLFSLTVVVALVSAMLRWFGVDDLEAAGVIVLIFLVWAVGIVCGAEFILDDLASLVGRRRPRPSEPPLELWDDAPPPQPPWRTKPSSPTTSNPDDTPHW